MDYLAIGYYITSLLSVPSSDTSNVQLKIDGEIDDHRLRLLLLELSKYRTISACAARLEMEIVFSRYATNIIEKTRLIASFLEQSSAVSKLMIQHTAGTEVFPSSAKALQSSSCLTTLKIMHQGSAYEHTCEEDFQVVKSMFEINNSLTQFSLSGIRAFACCIFQGLQHNKKLTHLNLRGTGLVATGDIAQALTTMLQDNKTLTHLDLSHNSKFSDQGAYFVFQGLQHNNTLVYLNLSYMGLEMTKKTSSVLATMLQVNNTLAHLDLSNNDSFAHFGSGIWFNFESLQCNTTLVHLNLSNTGLVVTEATAEALTTMLQVNKTLTHLDLSNNLKFQNASCVFQGLQNNTTLVYLNLSNIKLDLLKDTRLPKALKTMLQENKHLEHLDLSYNLLYDGGFYYVCEGLQHNTTLVYLNLSNTRLTDKGAKYIARAYNSNRSLKLSLEIRFNDNIGDYKVYTRMMDSWRNGTLKLIYQYK